MKEKHHIAGAIKKATEALKGSPENSKEIKPEENKGDPPITLEEYFSASKVPRAFHHAKLSDFSDTVLKQIEKRVVGSEGVFLYGPPGCGKTRLAAALVAYYFEAGKLRAYRVGLAAFGLTKPVKSFMRWEIVPELLMKFRLTYDREYGGKTDLKMVDDLCECDLLVLDDYGAEKVSDWTNQMLYIIVAKRLDNLRPTIVTSNLDLEQINEVNPRLASRFGAFADICPSDRDYRLEIVRPR